MRHLISKERGENVSCVCYKLGRFRSRIKIYTSHPSKHTHVRAHTHTLVVNRRLPQMVIRTISIVYNSQSEMPTPYTIDSQDHLCITYNLFPHSAAQLGTYMYIISVARGGAGGAAAPPIMLFRIFVGTFGNLSVHLEICRYM